MDGRFSVAIDDVKKVAVPVLRHRVSTNFQAQAEGKTSEDIIRQLMAAVGPREEGKYDVKVSIQDATGATADAQSTATITDAAVFVTGNFAIRANPGVPSGTQTVATFTDPAGPEAIGDYVGGCNHVLPTARSARFSSGLSVLDFMKRTSILKCGPDQLRALGPAAIALGEAEGLDAHARSVAMRFNPR